MPAASPQRTYKGTLAAAHSGQAKGIPIAGQRAGRRPL